MQLNLHTAEELQSIQRHNDLVKTVDKSDTIRVLKVEDGISYFYQDVDISKSLFHESKNGKIVIDFNTNRHHPIHYSRIQKNEREYYTLTLGSSLTCKNLFKYANYHDDQLSGQFKERCLFTDHAVQGSYMLIDSIHSDTTFTYDPETYTETVRVVKRTKCPIKCGTWQLTNSQGKQVEQFVECK